jgi:D-arabinitol 2-dehydrogenase
MSAFAPMLRQATRRAALAAKPSVVRPAFVSAQRSLHHVPPRSDKPGSYSRTDKDIEVEYPAEDDLPSSKPVRGIPGQYVKPTLSTFTLDGNVGVVTGGARGLGLVIGQGMVYSGADLALVDMNSEFSRLYLTTIRVS